MRHDQQPTSRDLAVRRLSQLTARGQSLPRRWSLAARGADVARSVLVERGVRAVGQVSGISIGADSVVERRCRLTVSMAPAAAGARLRIGARVLIGEGTFLTAHRELVIEDDVLIAAGCYVTEANHGLSRHLLIREQPQAAAPVTIGRGAWLGAHAVILPGVSIGEGAVVGANSVVTRDVPPFTVVGGVPARRIADRG